MNPMGCCVACESRGDTGDVAAVAVLVIVRSGLMRPEDLYRSLCPRHTTDMEEAVRVTEPMRTRRCKNVELIIRGQSAEEQSTKRTRCPN